MNTTTGIVIVVVIVIILILLFFTRGSTSNQAPYSTTTITRSRVPTGTDMMPQSDGMSDSDSADGDHFEEPVKEHFTAYVTQPSDSRYVYNSEYGVWLLPYNDLDFTNPYDRWMYYYYPSYYSSNYNNYWPYRNNYYGGNYLNRNRYYGNRYYGNRYGNWNRGRYGSLSGYNRGRSYSPSRSYSGTRSYSRGRAGGRR